MITVTVSGKPGNGQERIARSIYDALVGSRHIVRLFPSGRPSEMPEGSEHIINVIDETKESK